jgi:hypothetical protein
VTAEAYVPLSFAPGEASIEWWLELKTGHRREAASSGERVERRIAAILAADVAEYSRLMGQ